MKQAGDPLGIAGLLYFQPCEWFYLLMASLSASLRSF